MGDKKGTYSPEGADGIGKAEFQQLAPDPWASIDVGSSIYVT
jgi:hypothetical protein